jgi:predicted ATPase/DNA-binding winged helix-turn-helix (wHTH) protein
MDSPAAEGDGRRSGLMRNTDLGARDVVSFGPFRLFAAERLLEKAGVPVQVGSRALDILIVLVEHAGQVVSKKDLIARVWPDVTVDESGLRVHVLGLRKALGDGEAGARYVTNVPGRGYCFVAPVARPKLSVTASVPEPMSFDRFHGLPPRLTRMVGRDETVRLVSEQLAGQRFVTILGPGGIGKTTVAVSVGHAQLAAFDGSVRFLDLGPLNDPRLVPTALASMLGLLVQSEDSTPSVINFLRDRRMLLILDSCEHVIETVATLAERIFEEAPQVHILATSRELLQVEGEHVHWISALDSPPDGAELNATQVLSFPAARLFVERATVGGHGFELTDANAPIVAGICRKLDGIALAIELAAGRVGAYGIRETAALLDNRLRLLWQGRRTALPRHQTLSATLDWSYDLLTEPERAVLRRLSVFVGFFTLEAARAVGAGEDIHDAQVVEAMGRLVSKSLVSTGTGDTMMRYRLLDATRAYAVAKLVDSGEADATARRHAVYYCECFDRLNVRSPACPQAARFALCAESLGNLRAALEWGFLEQGDIGLGTALAARSARLFLESSLLSECHRWTERALAALDDHTRGTQREMELQAALGLSLMFTKGNSEQVNAALTRGLELAEELRDLTNQLRLLGRLHIFHERAGDFHRALSFAQRGESVAREIADPVGISAAQSLLGLSYHLIGRQADARTHLEAALVHSPASQRINTIHFGFHHRNRARIALARTLWLQGCPDQAVRLTRQTIEEAGAIGHPVTLCIALIWAVSVFHWVGDSASAAESIERFIAHADRHSLAPYHAVGRGMRGELSVKCGRAEVGTDLLRSCLETLHADRYELMTTAFYSALAEGLAMTKQFDQALVTIDETIDLVERNGDLFNLPESLRLKGEFLVSVEEARQAEECFLRSLELAGQQSAPSWELRTTTSLAGLWLRQGRRDEARAALAQVYARFSEGFETADLKAAKQFLDDTGGAASFR